MFPSAKLRGCHYKNKIKTNQNKICSKLGGTKKEIITKNTVVYKIAYLKIGLLTFWIPIKAERYFNKAYNLHFPTSRSTLCVILSSSAQRICSDAKESAFKKLFKWSSFVARLGNHCITSINLNHYEMIHSNLLEQIFPSHFSSQDTSRSWEEILFKSAF